jgi:hypothetical protein
MFDIVEDMMLYVNDVALNAKKGEMARHREKLMVSLRCVIHK